MTHAQCGGVIREDPAVTYEYDASDFATGPVVQVPALRCERCGVEIVGDGQIDLGESYDNHN